MAFFLSSVVFRPLPLNKEALQRGLFLLISAQFSSAHGRTVRKDAPVGGDPCPKAFCFLMI